MRTWPGTAARLGRRGYPQIFLEDEALPHALSKANNSRRLVQAQIEIERGCGEEDQADDRATRGPDRGTSEGGGSAEVALTLRPKNPSSDMERN